MYSKARTRVSVSSAVSRPACLAAPQPGHGRAAVIAGDHGDPAAQRRDRHQAAGLEVEAAAVIAGMLDDEVADESHRRSRGDGVTQQHRQIVAATGGGQHGVGDRTSQRHPGDGSAVGDHRRQQQCILLGGVRDPRRRRGDRVGWDRANRGLVALAPSAQRGRPQRSMLSSTRPAQRCSLRAAGVRRAGPPRPGRCRRPTRGSGSRRATDPRSSHEIRWGTWSSPISVSSIEPLHDGVDHRRQQSRDVHDRDAGVVQLEPGSRQQGGRGRQVLDGGGLVDGPADRPAGLRTSAEARSTTRRMPTGFSPAPVTTRWWNPHSTIRRNASPTRVSAPIVAAGERGERARPGCARRRARRPTPVRKSLSVTMPISPPRSISAHDWPASVITAAASPTVASAWAPDDRAHLVAGRAQRLIDQSGAGQPFPGDQRPVVAELESLRVLQHRPRVGEAVTERVFGGAHASSGGGNPDSTEI